MSYPVTFFFLLVHTVAFAGLYPFYSFEAMVLCAVLTVNFGMAITVVYHRYLTHGGFKTSTFMHRALTLWGLLAGEGPPLIWVANHRKHHNHSDDGTGEDPHSPLDGFWHSHIGWMMEYHSSEDYDQLFRRYVKTLMRDPFMRRLQRLYILLHGIFASLIFWCGYLYGGLFMATSFVVYGYFLRVVLVWHITWLVNSATHVWGYRTYETSDGSRNCWWVALLAQGEGWHNNHHAHPTIARAGHKWWEVDTSYWLIIWPLKKLHIIWDVIDKLPDKKVDT